MMSSLKQAHSTPTRAILNFNFWSWPGLNFFKNRCSGSPAGSKRFARGSHGFRFGFDCLKRVIKKKKEAELQNQASKFKTQSNFCNI